MNHRSPPADAPAAPFLAKIREHGVAFHYTAVSTTEFDYYYAMPIRSFGDIDRISAAFMELGKKMGEAEFDAFMRDSSAALDRMADWVFVRRDDLSYQPATPRLTAEQVKFLRYEFVYLHPGEEKAAENVSKEWVALYRSKGLADGYTTYQAVMGGDLPLLVYVTAGTSPADLETQGAKVQEALGAEGQALMGRSLRIIRRYEVKTGRLRPDLSNPAPPSS